jgi:GR25 family glycosyltransferase involved in LPS biosynthesis
VCDILGLSRPEYLENIKIVSLRLSHNSSWVKSANSASGLMKKLHLKSILSISVLFFFIFYIFQSRTGQEPATALPFERIFLINRISRLDRLLSSRKVLDYVGIKNVEIVDAVDLEEPAIQRASESNKKPPGVTACYASHLSVIRRVFNERLENALILEDDIDLPPNAIPVLQNLLKPFRFGTSQNTGIEWDLIFIGSCYEKLGNSPVSSFDGYAITKSINPECTHGYAVSLAGAKKILGQMKTSLPDITSGIDWALRDLVQSGVLVSYSVNPSMVVQWRNSPSDLRPMGEYVEQPQLEESTMQRLGE